ncbi:hypothetical protein MLD63_01260 (plasmid) [Paracoccus sp. TK19116]|uniref:Uncharacterized protein n=1 Tax=Paracoccus albicereus TaxID=2922394 RepID=A0ABT1ML96_9RHOB|nr:hypothetical protein [Paracoccus albicereus]MCQ0969062.1 hypothetical protein [Paracoccus albicereus]
MTTLSALAAFFVSSLVHTLTPAGMVAQVDTVGLAGPFAMSLSQTSAATLDVGWSHNAAKAFIRPDNIVLWALLIAVWGGLSIYAGSLVMRARMVPHRLDGSLQKAPWARPPAAKPEDLRPVELAPIAAALIAAALWPWVSMSQPLAGFVLTTAMMLAALTAVIRGQREGQRLRYHRSFAIFAGWATAVTYASFASLLTTDLGVTPGLAAVIAMVLCAGVGIIVQAQLGRATSFSIALIWALVGLSISAMASDPMVANAAVLGITAMIVMLVRAAS